MPTRRLDRHPDHVRTSQAVPEKPVFHVDPDSKVSYRQNEYDKCQQVYAAMSDFCNFDHGYLKVKRDSSGSEVHLTFTWTLTYASGSYVYVRCNHWELGYGLNVLIGKIRDVDSHSREPTPDKRNPRH